MDGIENLGEILGPILAIVVFMAINIFLRSRRAERTPLEIVTRILSEVNHNQKMAKEFHFQAKLKKFKTGGWKRNQAKLGFLDPGLQNSLADAFSVAEDFNKDIDAAKKYKSAGYLGGINVSRLSKPLAESKQGLEEWLQANTGRKESLPKRRGLFG